MKLFFLNNVLSISAFHGTYNDMKLVQHYENMPIQIYWKFYNQKMEIFR